MKLKKKKKKNQKKLDNHCHLKVVRTSLIKFFIMRMFKNVETKIKENKTKSTTCL